MKAGLLRVYWVILLGDIMGLNRGRWEAGHGWVVLRQNYSPLAPCSFYQGGGGHGEAHDGEEREGWQAGRLAGPTEG